ncbi:MAG: hypothetical protein ABSH06_08665 [Thermodesulfobacteriota bacterium]|jgi:hypothetical protein
MIADTKNKNLQKIVNAYMQADQPWPATTHEIAIWAVSQKLWKPPASTIIDECANQLARAMREEHIVDPQGRTVRAKHVARIERNGEQLRLWDDIRRASRQHMEVAFQQRRQQIVGDCRQLKTDIDSYNENKTPTKPIQMVFDFTLDLKEAEVEDASNF